MQVTTNSADTSHPQDGMNHPDPMVTYTITAIADPGALPRALELLAKRGLVPLSLQSQRCEGQLRLTMEMDGLAPAESAHIARCLGMIPLVTAVDMRLSATAIRAAA